MSKYAVSREKSIALTSTQACIIGLMYANPQCDLYQSCKLTYCYLSSSADLEYDPLPLDEAKELLSLGLIVSKWPDKPELNYWVLGERAP